MTGTFPHYIWRKAYIDQTGLHCVLLTLCRIFEVEMVQQNPHVRVEDVWAKYEERFPKLFKEYVSVSILCFYHIEEIFL